MKTESLGAINKIISHPHYSKMIKKLNEKEYGYFHDFINRYEDRDKNDFEILTNRLFLDQEKPKRYTEIQELLSAFNTMRFT